MVIDLCYTYILSFGSLYCFECAKNIYVLNVLIWGFAGGCMFLTGVWHLDLDLDIVTGLCYTYIPNFGFLILIYKVQRTSISLMF